MISKSLFLSTAAVAAFYVAQPAAAQVRTFNIEAQSAVTGVPQLALQSGLQIIAPLPDLQGRRITAVKGEMDAMAAVRQALTGSGLSIASNQGGVVILSAGARAAMEAEAQVEEIVVSAPIMQSLTRSLEIQRAADNVKSVIAADTVGRFPDQTAAGALARLPGVGVQRDQGQERYVQVRGAPTRWTSVALNGVAILGAEDRVFRFDAVPSTLIDQVDLNKTLTPAMPAEALSGQIDVKTYSPMSDPGFHVQAALGKGFVDLGDGPQDHAAARLSWSNDRFGVVLSGSHYVFEQQTDNAEPRFDATGMSQLRVAKYVIERETNALSAGLEFVPAEGHRLTFNSIYSEFIDDEERNQYTFLFNGAQAGTRAKLAGDLVGVEVRGQFNKGGQETSGLYNILHGEHAIAGGELTWDLAHSRSVLESGSPLIDQRQSAGLRPSLTFVAGDRGFPSVTLYDTNRSGPSPVRGGRRTSLDQLAFDQELITWSGSQRKTREDLAKVDYSREIDLFGAPVRLMAGLQYNDRQYRDVGSYSNTTPAGVSGGTFDARQVAAALGVQWTPLAMVSTRAVDEDLSRGFTFNYVENSLMRRQAEALFNAARTANASGATFAVPQLSPQQLFTVDERLIAAYATGRVELGRHRVVAGARIENTKIQSAGTAVIGGTRQPLDLENDQTRIFPSLHWTYEAREDLQVRAALVSGSARPSFGALSANVNINDANGTISGGNPVLKPETAYGLDGSIEWYFAPASVLSANVFWRKVDNVLFGSTATVGDGRYDGQGFDRSGYDFSTTVNGEDGDLYGVEFAYVQPFRFLPGALSGLGVETSLTLLDGEFTTPDGRKTGFPGTSKRITNLTAFYEKHGVSARLSWQHRTKWLDEVGAAETSDFWWAAQQRLDLSVRYQIDRNYALFFDANNLTNEEGMRWQGDVTRPYELEGYGRRFMGGVRVSF